MQDLNGKRWSSPAAARAGLAMVEALAACGANVTAIGANRGSAVLGETGEVNT